jgi:hypothetical protein
MRERRESNLGFNWPTRLSRIMLKRLIDSCSGCPIVALRFILLNFLV